mmetsp:Transcript_22414/g.33882  ORF Transcript_22414/g.33882 Transcript_22414/m.33882 type:complete len:86 (+) Transcript_22414:106-363(+)
MVLSEQAMRNWKVATYVCTLGTAFYTIFYVPYPTPPHLEGKKHALTDVQQSYHQMVDRYFWGIPSSTEKKKHEIDASPENAKQQR